MLQENKLECVTPEQKAGAGLSCCVLYDLNVLAGIPNVPLCMSAQACHGSERKEADGASNTRRSWDVMTLCCCHCLDRKPPSLGRRRKGLVSAEVMTIAEGKKKKKQYQQGQKILWNERQAGFMAVVTSEFLNFPFFHKNLKILQCPQNVSYPQGRRMWCAHLQSEYNNHTWHKVEISFHEGQSTNAESSELQAHRSHKHRKICCLI